MKTIVISATVTDNILNYKDKFLDLKIDKFLEKAYILDKSKGSVNLRIKQSYVLLFYYVLCSVLIEFFQFPS